MKPTTLEARWVKPWGEVVQHFFNEGWSDAGIGTTACGDTFEGVDRASRVLPAERHAILRCQACLERIHAEGWGGGWATRFFAIEQMYPPLAYAIPPVSITHDFEVREFATESERDTWVKASTAEPGEQGHRRAAPATHTAVARYLRAGQKGAP